MYYEHFGLTQAPFKITPNTEFFFSGGNRGPVLEALLYAITRGEGIVKVTGEVGSGKTMLCNMLQNRLPDTVESVYLANPSVGPEEVLHAIAFELQLGVDRHADRLEVMHALQDYLVQRHAEGKRVVVFVEESQSMPIATLEEMRLLSNLETSSDKLLQIVMFGQPELDANLKRPEIRQLRDRIAHSFSLQPLTVAEVSDYLMFRMRAAGYRGPAIFSASVVKQIAKASSGLTRRINLIADKALLAAFAENTHTIRPRHVRAALRDSEFGRAQIRWRPSAAVAWAALGLLAGAGLGAALYATLGPFGNYRDAAPSRVIADSDVLQGVAAGEHAASSAAGTTLQMVSASAAAPVAADAPLTEGATAAPAPASGAEAPTNAAGAAGMAVSQAPAENEAPPEAPPAAAPAPAAPASSAPSSPPPKGRRDIVADRMEVTERWLHAGEAPKYSIQLLVAPGEAKLRNHLKLLTKFIELDDIYMYRSVGRDSSAVNVLYGSFDSREAALRELGRLPELLQANRPYVRPVSAVRAEIDLQHPSSAQ